MKSDNSPSNRPLPSGKKLALLLILAGLVAGFVLLAEGKRTNESAAEPDPHGDDTHRLSANRPGSRGGDSSSAPVLAVDPAQLSETDMGLLHRLRDALDSSELLAAAEARKDAGHLPLLLLRSGEELYAAGCYSQSLSVLEKAWEFALSTRPGHWREHKLIATIGARLGELYARLGRTAGLRTLLTAMEGRPIEGAETLAFDNLRQAAEGMEQFPEHSFKCGPLALGRVIGVLRPDSGEPGRIAEIASPRAGFSLAEVVTLGNEMGFPVKAVRPGDGHIPVPSVVHWRSEHYAAITQFNEGRYLVEDPTFQRSVWMSPEAIRRETSGFFVVPADRANPAWALASSEQAAATFGKGTPSQRDSDDQGGDEDDNACRGLPAAGFNNFYASLTIRDIPLFYTPPAGPAVDVQLTYFDASNYDNATAQHGHPGRKWLLGWVRHIEVPQLNTAGATFRVVRANGRTEKFEGRVDQGSMRIDKSGLHTRSRLAVSGGASGSPLTRVVKSLPDGSSETYGYLESGGNSQAFGAVMAAR